MNNKTNKTRKRVFRGYPNDVLEKSILDARDISEQNLGIPIRKKALAKLWGISVNSSNYTSKINNMRGYGLTPATKGSDFIELTALCKEILEPANTEQYHRVLREASCLPKKFSEFYKLLEDKKIPSVENLKRIIVQNIFVERELVDEFITITKENGVFSGLINQSDESFFVENINSDNDNFDFEPESSSNSYQEIFENEDSNIQRFKPTIVETKKYDQILLKYFNETKTLSIIKDLLKLLKINYSEYPVSISDPLVTANVSDYCIFIIDSNAGESSNDIQFWMQLGAYLSQSKENYLFLSSFGQLVSVPDIYREKILKLQSSEKDYVFVQLLKHLIDMGIIDINLS
ncbi:MAG: hypothetical protein ACJ0DE_05530 [Dehalococcoidia bacterium]